MKETLTTNNMETLNPTEKKVEETAYVDTKKLAEEALAHNAEFKEAADEEKRASAAEYEAVKNRPVGETENKKETAESKEADSKSIERRVAYIKAGVKLITDALEVKMNSSWISRGFVSKEDFAKCIKEVKFREEMALENTGQAANAIDWKTFVRQANFLDDKNILAQLEAMKTEYLKPQDEFKINPLKEQMQNQITASSMGASGDSVQF